MSDVHIERTKKPDMKLVFVPVFLFEYSYVHV